jgi:hypothetical protein
MSSKEDSCNKEIASFKDGVNARWKDGSKDNRCIEIFS